MQEKTRFFEVVTEASENDESLYEVEGIFFRPLEVSAEEKSELLKKVSEWELIDSYEYCDEDLAYDDKTEGKGERVITDELLASFIVGSFISNQVRGGYLFKDGQFAGMIIETENVSSYGMSVNKSNGLGLLLTDGRKLGKTDYHYFHSGTESSESRSSEYTLRHK
ncbi:MAG: hypothetical protein IJ115_07730 [Erysipelotrichaceae bacterium]|nr:hypothetical protein [Erysipelotrichaceae bacterium]